MSVMLSLLCVSQNLNANRICWIQFRQNWNSHLFCETVLFSCKQKTLYSNFETDSQDEAKTCWVVFNRSTEKGPAEETPWIFIDCMPLVFIRIWFCYPAGKNYFWDCPILIWSRNVFLSTQMYIKIFNHLKKCNKYGILRYQIFSVQRNMFWNYHKYILPSASLTCARSREKQGNVNADPTANASPPPPSNLINDDDQDDYDNYQDHPCRNFWA